MTPRRNRCFYGWLSLDEIGSSSIDFDYILFEGTFSISYNFKVSKYELSISWSNVKKWKIFSNFVAYSEYMHFIFNHNLCNWVWVKIILLKLFDPIVLWEQKSNFDQKLWRCVRTYCPISNNITQKSVLLRSKLFLLRKFDTIINSIHSNSSWIQNYVTMKT